MSLENQIDTAVTDPEFAAAFAEFSAPGEKKTVETPAPAAETTPAAPAAEATPATPAAEVTPAAPAAEATPAAPAAEATPAAPAAEATPAAPAAEATPAAPAAEATPAAPTPAELAAMRAEIDALKKPPEQPAAPAPIYEADEQTTVNKYLEEWPDVAKGEALVRRAEYHALVKHVFSQIEQRYGPVLEYIDSRSERDQYTDILKLVPDYDTVRDKAIAWIDTQPTFLQPALRAITSQGSPEDVAGLINLYKSSVTPVAAPAAPAAPAATAATAAPAAPAAPAVSPAAAKVAAKLSVVSTSRSTQPQGKDDNDFNGAFEEYAAKEVVRK